MTVKETLDKIKDVDEALKMEYVGDLDLWSDERAIGALIQMLKNKKFSEARIMAEVKKYSDILCEYENKELEETYKTFIQYMNKCADGYLSYMYGEYEINEKTP